MRRDWPVGLKITAVRPMTREELCGEAWPLTADPPAVVELEDGSVFYASRDGEGNGPGALFFVKSGGTRGGFA